MTCPAKFIWHIRAVGHYLRHVCLVALAAVSRSHFRRVRLVALRARRFLAVYIMAGGTEQRRMLALVLLELLDLRFMAGQTCLCYIAAKSYFQRCMRIFVAAQTIFKFIMWLAGMALIAFRNVVLHRGWMPDMTARATNSLMFATACCYVSRRICVTFGTVII